MHLRVHEVLRCRNVKLQPSSKTGCSSEPVYERDKQLQYPSVVMLTGMHRNLDVTYMSSCEAPEASPSRLRNMYRRGFYNSRRNNIIS